MSADALKAVGWKLIDLIWPRRCAVEGCGKSVDRVGRHICSTCFSSLPFDDEPPIPPENSRGIDMMRSALVYGEPIDALLRAFKYERKAVYLADDFVDLLEGAVRAKFEFEKIDLVVSVPIHPNRYRERGYNQSDILATMLAERIDRKCMTDALERIVDTPHQARVSKEDRLKNLGNAFVCAKPEYVRDRVVLLVDDVTTSGSTFSSVAQVLKRAGAKKVWCVSVARRAPERD